MIPAESLFGRESDVACVQSGDKRFALSRPIDDVIGFSMPYHQEGHWVATTIHQLFVVIHPVVYAQPVVLLDRCCVDAVADNGKVGSLCTPEHAEIILKSRAAGIIGHRLAGKYTGEHVGVPHAQRQRSGSSHGMSLRVNPLWVNIERRRDFVDGFQNALLGKVFNTTVGRNGSAGEIIVIRSKAVPPGLVVQAGAASAGVIQKDFNAWPAIFGRWFHAESLAVGMRHQFQWPGHSRIIVVRQRH